MLGKRRASPPPPLCETHGLPYSLFRSQDGRKERQAKREAAHTIQRSSPEPSPMAPLFEVEEYSDMTLKGSFDNGDPLTTNLYVGNINPNVRRLVFPSFFFFFFPFQAEWNVENFIYPSVNHRAFLSCL